MTKAPPRLWVTRAQPQAEATARRLRALGIEAVIQPVLQVVPIADAVLDLSGADALAFTSQAAVTAFAARSSERGLRVFPVGAATAAAARAAGFSRIEAPSAQGDVQGLAATIAAEPRPALVVNPTALEPAADLGALLAGQGVAIRPVAIYRTVRTGLAIAPNPIDGVLIHSAKAGVAVAELVSPEAAGGLVAYVISDAAAASLRERGFGRILIPERPDEASLLERIEIDQNRTQTHEKP